MAKVPWKPWHKVVQLRDDVRTGELSLATFAADLYDVVMNRAKPVYQKPEEFFALTYPTFNLRELAKDVIHRLAGKNEKAVRQLELTYGGGKTHTEITLYHLTVDPDHLPDLPAVKQFIEHAGMKPPKARIGVLAFDKLDVEKGMEIRDPQGKLRWLKQPWSVLAWQLAGSDGIKLLHADNKDEERDTPPAENLMTTLLALPARDGLATLVLIDEVLMYARARGEEPAFRGHFQNFFQYMTQAATKVDRCAIVASLLATDPNKSDKLGKEITKELYEIFRREREEGVQPVVKEDVAEVLRRRFFKAKSIENKDVFREHVITALKGIGELDEQTRKEAKHAEEEFIASYPFHPDITEVLYTKWTNLESFQRTRGALRTFALALREAEKWDESPLISANVFLSDPGKEDISESLRELASVATSEEYEGKRQEWSGILQGELDKARAIQGEFTGLRSREMEQAVVATFLHSQPTGHKASTRELLVLLGHTRPDKIEVEKGLKRWTDVSWFLDEGTTATTDGSLPNVWRLGSKPNLRQMHNEARREVVPELVEAKLLDAVSGLKSLVLGASAAGATVHMLPDRPSDIEDNGEFHYAVLKPKAASMAGNPSPEAKRFLEETTSPERPRVYRNALVLAVPSRDGIEAVRNRIRDYLAWEAVPELLKGQDLDPIRAALLRTFTDEARKRIPDTVQQAYSIIVTVSEKGITEAFKVTVSNEPLFTTIKSDKRSRIQDSPVNAEALLPEGPYDLWKAGETSRRVKDLVGAFAQFPHLPKMLRRDEIVGTLAQGAKDGLFVLQATRPDRSVRTLWRVVPSAAELADTSLEVVLNQVAKLTELAPELLVPGALPTLWTSTTISVRQVLEYLSGGKELAIQKEGYTEALVVPKTERSVIEVAIREAVEAGKLWLLSGPASILGEQIPTGVLTETAQLSAPPTPIPATDVLPASLPEAWGGDETTAVAIAAALSQKYGKPLPWAVVREAIDGAIRASFVELTIDSGTWPSPLSAAQSVKVRVPAGVPRPTIPTTTPTPGVHVADAELKPNQIQDLADIVADLVHAAVGHDLRFRLRIELKMQDSKPTDAVTKINKALKEVAPDLQMN